MTLSVLIGGAGFFVLGALGSVLNVRVITKRLMCSPRRGGSGTKTVLPGMLLHMLVNLAVLAAAFFTAVRNNGILDPTVCLCCAAGGLILFSLFLTIRLVSELQRKQKYANTQQEGSDSKQ